MEGQQIASELAAVLNIPFASVVNEENWHKNVTGVFVPTNRREFTHDALDTGRLVLRDFPVEELKIALDDATSPEAQGSIRMLRKILMIGRDTVILSGDDISSKGLNPIFDLSRSVGQVRDTKGTNAIHIEAAKLALSHYPEAVDGPLGTIEPVSILALQDSLQVKLFPLIAQGHTIIHPREFHTKRRDFRRVVHFGYISTLLNRTDETTRYLAEGKSLNEQYGTLHDRMTRKTQVLQTS